MVSSLHNFLISLNVMFLQYIFSSFIFGNMWHFLAGLFHNLHIHSSVNAHLGCLQVLAITNSYHQVSCMVTVLELSREPESIEYVYNVYIYIYTKDVYVS